MPNAKDLEQSAFRRIFMVGRTGSGKSAQFWSLPGKKFVYIFDPNALSSFQQRDRRGNKVSLDIDYELFLPDVLEVDATLKGFNKDSKDDHMAGSKREPTVYNRWVNDINQRVESGFFKDYQWLGFDSTTFLSKATMARQMYINKRYGAIEDLGDYRVVGSKISEVFSSIASLPINIYACGHINVFENDKTKRIETLINLPGQARNMLPLVFTDVLQAQTGDDKSGNIRYQVRTKPDRNGLQDIRSSIPMDEIEDITIEDFGDPEKYGIGALLKKYG